MTQAERDTLPYPPEGALPGAHDVPTPYGSVRVYEWGPEDGERVLLIAGISTPTLSLGDLAWEMSNGRASLVAEPVPLYDRAISAALDFLAARGACRDEPDGPAHSRNPIPEAAMPSAANF